MILCCVLCGLRRAACSVWGAACGARRVGARVRGRVRGCWACACVGVGAGAGVDGCVGVWVSGVGYGCVFFLSFEFLGFIFLCIDLKFPDS